MKRFSLFAIALTLFWSCDTTPGGNKNILPTTYSNDEFHGGEHHDPEDEAHTTTSSTEKTDISKSVRLVFTAFKTDAKKGVDGQFTNYKVIAKQGGDIYDQLQDAEITIQTKSITTGDSDRDNTLRNEFFAKLAGETIQGKIVSISDNKANIEITLNQKTIIKSFDFFVSNENPNAGLLKGSIDLLSDFSANTAFDSLAKACEALHAGKTWTDVELNVNFEL